MADASLSANTSLASLLSGIFSGSYGLNQLFGSGSSTAAGSAAAGAAAASPFQSQFGQYQGQIQGNISGQQGYQNNLGVMMGLLNSRLEGTNTQVTGNSALTQLTNTLAGTGLIVPTSVSGSGQSLQDQVAALSSNYMSNPAIQAQYQLGLDTVNRGLQASGYGGSGQQQVALEQYGQQYASQAYTQQLNNILNTSNATFNQNVGATQLGAGLQNQQFTQALGANQQQAGFQQSSISNQLQSILGEYSADISGSNTLLNSQQGLNNLLATLSGATTGSPATAGSILSGQFGNSQTAAGNLGAGLSGILSGINGLTGGGLGNGVGDLLNSLLGNGGSYGSLLGGGISQFIDQFGGGIGSLGTSLGVGAGGLEGLVAGGADTAGSEGLSALLGL